MLKSRWPYCMQSRFWVDKLKGLFQKSCFCSQVKMAIFNLEWTKYRGVISWSGYMYYSLSEYISHHLKRQRTTCRLKALDAYLNKKYILWMKTNHYPNKITFHSVTIVPMTSFTLKSTSKLRSFLHLDVR